jgi:CPA2 family monovalent cation:H+ antiporter-2
VVFEHVGLLGVVDFDLWNALRDILLLLLVALLLGTIAERLRQSVIVGYLIAGTVVGPNALGWISKQQEIYYIAELGVALLLFVIGLEFSPRRLLELGKRSLGTGIMQILVTAAATWVIARACGIGGQEALVIGMMIAMSSTVCVLRLLTDRAELDGLHGRAALGILLVQDVAVVPMMLAVSAIAGKQSLSSVAGKLSLSVLLAVALVGTFYVLFTFVAPRLFNQRVWQRNRDLPILLAMILALGCAWAAHQLKLSPALGAFAGGVLLAVSPFATQIRADVRPLSTVLVTLFFASIGMFGDPWWLLQNGLLVTGLVLAIVVGKPLVIAVLARLFGQPWRYAVATGLCLAQIGEFSFVLATIAQTQVDGVALMSAATFRALVSATIISLLLTPYLVAVAPRVGSWSAACISRLRKTRGSEDVDDAPDADESESTPSDSILIIGFGPAGQRVVEGLMDAHQGRMVVVDLNSDNIIIANRYGLKGIQGDATQTEILEHAGIYRTRVVVLVLPDHNTTRQLIYLVRSLAPGAHIIARCRYHVRHWELLNAGAHEVVDEEDQVGRRLAEQVSQAMELKVTPDVPSRTDCQ